MKTDSVVSKEKIMLVVCDYYGVTQNEICSVLRKKEVRWPRQVYGFLCCEYTNNPLHKIGDSINRDHSTILHSKRTVLNEIEFNSDVRVQIEELKSRLFDVVSDEKLAVPKSIDLLFMSENHTKSLITQFT